MLYLNVLLKVKNVDDVAEVRRLLTEAARLSRREPGCLRFELYQSTNDPARFFLNEHWESQAALDAHRQAQAYTQIYVPQVIPKVDREGHPSELIS